ncbi:MAG: TlpA disulfide reductase family protein [Bacteroidota bacterium]
MKMPGKKYWIPLLLLAAYFGGRAWYFTPTVSTEELATDFTATRADGRSFQLSDLRGGYVLLDFWGSWCGPCRRKSPELVRLHQALKDRLTIVSIAIERDSTAWQRARTQDARLWDYQVLDRTDSFRFLMGDLASLYGVRRIPTNFLIDPAGKVIGIDVPLASIANQIQ